MLKSLAPVLDRLRALPGLVEKRPGVFYRRSKAFLHFHEDPAGFFADVRAAGGIDFDRLKIDVSDQGDAFVAHVKSLLT